MSKKAAAIPFFGDAYLADTTHLTTEEHGAYFLLLLAAWRQGDCALPDDDHKLARITGLTIRKWKAIRPTILGFWIGENGRIFQPRLRREHAYACKKSKQNSKAAKARWEAQGAENKQGGCMRTQSGRNAPPPPPTLSISNDMGGDPPSAADIRKIIFDTGKMILKASGQDDRRAGSIIGKWRKTYSDSQVLTVLARCQSEQPSDPVEWITKALQFEQRQAQGQTYAKSGGGLAGPAQRALAALEGGNYQ